MRLSLTWEEGSVGVVGASLLVLDYENCCCDIVLLAAVVVGAVRVARVVGASMMA